MEAREAKRDRTTGRYVDADMTAACTCGHTLGSHTAAAVDGQRDCLTCECDRFKKGTTMTDRQQTARRLARAVGQVTARRALVVADAIQELGSVPAGHLYAAVMGHMSLETFEGIVGVLVGAKLVRRDASHLLTWIGPRS